MEEDIRESVHAMKKASLTPARVMVAGVGGVGCRVVGKLRGASAVSLRRLAMDTDSRSLEECGVAERLLLGSSTGRGAGAGGDPVRGRNAASETAEELRAAFVDASVVVCVAGLGGGTGTGALPVALRAAREGGSLALAMFTTPFGFEGRRRRDIALNGFGELREHADVMAAVSSDRLIESVGNASVEESFSLAEDALSGALTGMCSLASGRALFGVDMENVRRLFRENGGLFAISHAESSGPGRGVAAARAALRSPLIGGDGLGAASAVLVSIVGGRDLRIGDVSEAMDVVAQALPESAEMSMGIAMDDQLDRVAVTLLVLEGAGEQPQGRLHTDEPGQPAAAPQGDEKPRRRSGTKARDDKLTADHAGRDRFRGSEMTTFDGEDLDTPTYQRKGIRIAD